MKNGWTGMILAATAAVLVLASDSALGAQERLVPTSREQVQLSYAPVVGEAAPAVVNIYTKTVTKGRGPMMFDDPIFRRFFSGQPRERVSRSLGSGVIVRPNGVIVTNNHVIDGADEITVVLNDRREYEAELVLADPRTDLAILQIDTGDEELATLTLSDSEQVLVGDIVLAIGNPFGIGQTVTSGIVSATARTQQGISDFGFFIQTDAAVNPGNSGGALVGVNGELLGINTAIYTRTGTTNGIGFAVPSNMVKSVLRAALNEGELVRPWLGIDPQNVTAALASSLGLDRAGGVLINDIFPGGPADAAGLQVGDVILAVDGKEVVDGPQLNFRIATLTPGEEITLTVLSDGFPEQKKLALDLPPETPDRDVTELDGRHPFQGVTVGNLNPRFNEELQLRPLTKGVVVLEVAPRTPSGVRGYLRRGDFVLQMNGVTIDSVDALERALAESAARYDYRIIRRGRVTQCVIIPNQGSRCQVQR